MLSRSPVLHLTTGLPGTGKTTLAREIEARDNALRLTPDEWMNPLFGHHDADGKRDVLEGRLVWVGYRALRAGADVILDFGCWSPEERYAVRSLAELAGGRFVLHYLHLPEAERRARAGERWLAVPHETFEMTAADHDSYQAAYRAPDANELGYGPMPPPPAGQASWPSYAAARWPTLPDFSLGQ
ncbi:conserved hypothetical protein [Nostocoides australiense Ben110]|uniref:Kinase n=1 Tax=Nostocoides australiense Ben110 TaxID=1193182 RepID=W6JZ14_9MICO|nr:ATP-binding protein [Tetrasphaera australiensis]CCH73981.1 conserved hypothetical protein [Tetrasphaera australiensis Ben110]